MCKSSSYGIRSRLLIGYREHIKYPLESYRLAFCPTGFFSLEVVVVRQIRICGALVKRTDCTIVGQFLFIDNPTFPHLLTVYSSSCRFVVRFSMYIISYCRVLGVDIYGFCIMCTYRIIYGQPTDLSLPLYIYNFLSIHNRCTNKYTIVFFFTRATNWYKMCTVNIFS